MNTCTSEHEIPREQKIRQYRDTLRRRPVTADDLLIGSWVSFYSFRKDPFEYQTRQLADAGLNFNIFPGGFPGTDPATMPDWDTIEAEYAADNMVYFMPGGLEEQEFRDGVRLAAGKAHCIGYHLVDEPGGSALPHVGDVVRRFREADGKRYPFVNLLPSYAGEAATPRHSGATAAPAMPQKKGGTPLFREMPVFRSGAGGSIRPGKDTMRITVPAQPS